MDIFAQKKILIRLVIFLTVLNLFSIGIFLWKDILHKPPPPVRSDEKGDLSVILEKKLNLTGKQVEQIEKLRSSFMEKENEIQTALRKERDSMNLLMFNKITNEEQLKSLARSVAENEYKMELLRIEQAKELKSVCTPEQLEKFEKLVREIRDYFKPDIQPKGNR